MTALHLRPRAAESGPIAGLRPGSRIGLRLVLGLALALAAVLAIPAAAHAGTPFDGKVVTSAKRIPLSAKSKQAYYAKLRKQSAAKFQEDKEKKAWKVHFAAFFKQPLNDLEVTVKLYDVTDKQKHLKASFEQFLDGRGQTTVISHVDMAREQFGVNRKILIAVENRGRVLAQGTFEIHGEAEKYSGKVDFTEDE
jgi:ethanolamine utilization protein EutP (predicted NTPase)